VKIVVLTPIPNPRESTAIAVKAGFFTNVRSPYFTSRRKFPINKPHRDDKRLKGKG
jgi:hypothetical protein